MIKHGRESLVKIAGGEFVSKEPLPGRSMSQKREWLARQQRAADTIQKLHEIGNDAYGVPHIKSIDSRRFCVLEERVSGVPLTPLLFRKLDDNAREKVVDSLAQFYADMHSIDVIPNPIEYKMEYGLDVEYLENFLEDVEQYFSKKEIKSVRDEIKFIDRVYQHIINTSYETRIVWVHGDLFDGNVLYDYKTQKFNIIDFTDAGTSFLHYDMLRSYSRDLGVADAVRTQYLKYRDVRDLPADFVDDARWKQIAQYHNAANVLEKMNEEVTDVQYLGKNERSKMLDRLKQQINVLHKHARGF
ncbi:MAG: aminoglycoside phosphotransferase family protein [Alphaproteobacteria bacterium]|nr:aminoglycoside phosphotransferase family protein [Alphaproteobacteria bacterium]